MKTTKEKKKGTATNKPSKNKLCAVCGRRPVMENSDYCCLNCEDYAMESQADYDEHWYR